MLSEEEIIKDLKKYISFANKSENFSNNNDFKWNVELSEIIQGLLDLYNKEKEKIQKYEKQLNLDYVDENFISKDKIKEIMYPTPNNPIPPEVQMSKMYRKIIELLEE